MIFICYDYNLQWFSFLSGYELDFIQQYIWKYVFIFISFVYVLRNMFVSMLFLREEVQVMSIYQFNFIVVEFFLVFCQYFSFSYSVGFGFFVLFYSRMKDNIGVESGFVLGS